jgi:hypothetical protein
MIMLRTASLSLLLAALLGCKKNRNEGLVLHYIDLSNKTLPVSLVVDSKPKAIMNDALSAIQNAETLQDKRGFLIVYDRASLLAHYIETSSSHFTVQHIIADAECDKAAQLTVDSVFVEARRKIGERLDDELLILDDYIAATSDGALQDFFVRLKEATIEVKKMIETSSATATFD